MTWLLCSWLAYAAPLTLRGEVSPAVDASGGGMLVGGSLRAGGTRWAFDGTLREGLLSGPGRSFGFLAGTVRRDLTGPLALRAGFAHAHQAPLPDALARPVAVALGTDAVIHHRSGLLVGGVAEWPLGERWFAHGGLDAVWWADGREDPWTLQVNGGIGVAFGGPPPSASL